MDTHELVLLTPYRFPAQYAMTLSDEDMASWLNGFTALWHPALLWQAKSLPRTETTYDHEQPKPGHIYALPESPPSYLPDNWDELVRQVGSIAFKATPDRETTLANLRAALQAEGVPALGWKAGFEQPAEVLGPFFGIGWGHLLLSALCEAMEHENLLDAGAFADSVQQAIALLGGLPYTATTTAVPSPEPTAEYIETSPDQDQESGVRSQESETRVPQSMAVEPTGTRAVDLANLMIPAEIIRAVPESLARTHSVIPVAEVNGGLQIAFSDPSDLLSIDLVRSTLNRQIEPVIATHEQILDAIDRYYAKPDWREPLKAAAARILSAREVLYPVTIHLLDACFLDEDSAWPASFEFGVPTNFIAPTVTLEKLAERDPARFAQLQAAVQSDQAEVLGGCYLEREDPILPIDSQLWNLRHGLDRARELLGADVRVYARKRFGYHPHLPLFLSSNGITKALFLVFDESSGLPNYSNLVVSWPSPDGKQVDAFARTPKYADSVETYFNLGHTWFKTTREDQTATIFLLHRNKPVAVWHRDLMELARLAPVLGQWTTFSRYLGEVMPGEYPTTMTADDFHFDFLSERIAASSEEPVSAFARHLRTRRRIDACWTYAALHRSLSGARDTLDVEAALKEVEKQAETTLQVPAEFADLEKRIASALAERLQARAEANRPGYMILNPCGFARRAAIELDGAAYPLPIGGIVKACQLDSGRMRAVIEVPALGFAWLPREGPPGTPAMTVKAPLGEQASKTIRNDIFEAEVDGATGGLKAIRDHKTRINRLGQMLVFNPGSRMVAKEIKVTSTGPALGEIVSEGVLLGEQGQTLATFRQRLRAWYGRPLLEMRIELTPQQPAAGYGWHAYFGARFAWRDERAGFVRGFNGMGYVSTHPRPQTPDYLDIRTPPLTVAIFPGGLPFHQKQAGRMVDLILIPEGEKATTFDIGIALDREVPMQTAWGYTSPLAIVPTTKGPPHIGASGWLFHIDASNLLLTRMMPGRMEPTPTGDEPTGPADAITARFLECANYSGLAEFRCVRDPLRSTVLDCRGQYLLEANRSGDVVHLEVSPNDLVHVQVEFS